ncbi:hypothetical protein JCM18918_1746 [Cutibacterium acnes JCM 18918]|nr:hypothetical protein JCM18918_1746 [Cutibacterium acnes JCM 18918]
MSTTLAPDSQLKDLATSPASTVSYPLARYWSMGCSSSSRWPRWPSLGWWLTVPEACRCWYIW